MVKGHFRSACDITRLCFQRLPPSVAGQRRRRLRRPKAGRQLGPAAPPHLDYLSGLRMLQAEPPIEAHLGSLGRRLGHRSRLGDRAGEAEGSCGFGQMHVKVVFACFTRLFELWSQPSRRCPSPDSGQPLQSASSFGPGRSNVMDGLGAPADAAHGVPSGSPRPGLHAVEWADIIDVATAMVVLVPRHEGGCPILHNYVLPS